MGLLKTRPDVSLYAPRLVEAGREHVARVVLRCPEPLPVNAVTVEFVGEEFWYTQSQYGRHGESSIFYRATSRPHAKGELSEGEHTFEIRFKFPAQVPHSYRGRHPSVIGETAGELEPRRGLAALPPHGARGKGCGLSEGGHATRSPHGAQGKGCGLSQF